MNKIQILFNRITYNIHLFVYYRLSQKLKDAARAQIESNGRINNTGNDDDAVLGNLQQRLAMTTQVANVVH